MKNFSRDIEAAIDNIIEGLEYPINIESIEAHKIKSLMKSKEDSFKYAKEMIHKWENSQNQPRPEKLKAYIERLVEAGDVALETLRTLFREKIDFKEVDEDRHHYITEGKSILHQAITNINYSLIELRNQLDADKFNLTDKEFKRGYPEKFANQELFPLKNYHKDWYDEEADSVMICPKGTKGKVITLDGLNITLPEEPEDKSEILFSDLDEDEQYWRRQEPPAGLNPESEEAFVDYIVEEFRRRREGIWFMNKGEAVYLTGSYYFILQHFKMLDDGNYMNFRYSQLNMNYHSEACVLDPRCVGELFVKSRRTGFTYDKIGRFLDEATSTSNATFGITSKSNEDASKAFEKLSYGFKNLPFYFQPVTSTSADNKKKIVFAKPADRSKAAKKKKDTNTDDYLNTIIDYQPTNEGSYDGQKMFRYLGDECLAKGTKILMADMSFKKIEDVNVGDYVMVEGGKSMRVKKASSGIDDMYVIKQPYGKDYVVNSNHKLYLEKGNRKNNKKFIKVTPKEYLSWNSFQQRITNRVVFSGVEFKEKDYFIDPYIMGCWLGDGYSVGFSLIVNHKKDQEIAEAFNSFAGSIGLRFNMCQRTDNETTSNITVQQNRSDFKDKGGRSDLNTELERLNLINNKHIPYEYLKGSIEQRLDLLAGIIDTDGHLHKSTYVIGMSRENLINDIYHLAKSCGLDVSEVVKRKSNFNTDVYAVRIKSNSKIKCRVKRKKDIESGVYRSRRSKMSVEYKGVGEYYGIELDTENDDDKRLVLEDYTLTMNCSKWENGRSFEEHWGQVSPTFDTGGKIVGKAFVGSTVAARNKGGLAFHNLFLASDVDKRNKITGRTPSGLYSYFLPAHKNMAEFTDKYGVCHEVVGDDYFTNTYGDVKRVGSVQYLEEMRKAKRKESEISYNNELRAFPMNTAEAFRDEANSCIFNIEKINEQLEYIEGVSSFNKVMTGSFSWKDGIPDTTVEWNESPNGKFKVTWLPPLDMQNAYETRMGFGGYSKAPLNGELGALGCDSYDISGTVDSVTKFGYDKENTGGSKGALHGLTRFSIGDVPSNHFFLEYVSRASTADKFFEDVLMACVFYGMPILVENNKPRLLYHFKNRGYRNFSITRPDKEMNRLSKTEIEIGGVPNSSEDMKLMHSSAIESYIDKNVGYNPETNDYGNMFFEHTLRDWLGFDINKRTKFDASISSGLAIMAVNRDKYRPKRESKPVKINLYKKKHR